MALQPADAATHLRIYIPHDTDDLLVCGTSLAGLRDSSACHAAGALWVQLQPGQMHTSGHSGRQLWMHTSGRPLFGTFVLHLNPSPALGHGISGGKMCAIHNTIANMLYLDSRVQHPVGTTLSHTRVHQSTASTWEETGMLVSGAHLRTGARKRQAARCLQRDRQMGDLGRGQGRQLAQKGHGVVVLALQVQAAVMQGKS